jgi:hypothetical protein
MLKAAATENIVPKVIYDIRSTQHHMKSDQDTLLTTVKEFTRNVSCFYF